MTRRLAYIASLLIVLCGLAFIPMPYVMFSPGPAIDLGGEVTVEGQGDPLSGNLAMLTVSVKEAGLLDVVRARFDARRDLYDRDRVINPDTPSDEHFAQQRRFFQDQARVSAAVALQALGRDVGIDAVVASVSAGGAADGQLEDGDVLRTVNGAGVKSVTDVRAALEGLDEDAEVPVTFEREGTPQEVTITLAPIPDDPEGRVGLGIVVATVVGELPIDVELSGLGEIGGPSAGLVLALAILDLLSPDDLVADRVLAITGTLNAEGDIGNIGGIRQKVFTAEELGAELMIVPSGQLDEARAASTTGMEIIGVGTFAEALAALAP